jgi:hypothetical protein
MSDLASTPTTSAGSSLGQAKHVVMPERRSYTVSKATSGGYILSIQIQGGELGWRDENHLFTDKASIAAFITENLDS